MVLVNLQSSFSLALVSVMVDGNQKGGGGASAGVWLHRPVLLRTRLARSFLSVAAALREEERPDEQRNHLYIK